MARILDSKCKLCRRAEEKLFLKGDRCSSPKCAMVRKAYPPGMHGKAVRKGLSEFGKQLAQKQKVKRIFGISECQFRKYFEEAKKKKGILGNDLIEILETRLDNVIYRLGLAQSRNQARQLVSHGNFLVNGRSLNIPSARIKVGDKIKVKETKLIKKYWKDLQLILKKGQKIPQWLSFDPVKMEGEIIAKPTLQDVGMELDLQAVIEFYSR